MFIRTDVLFRILYYFENTLHKDSSLSFQLNKDAMEDVRSMV